MLEIVDIRECFQEILPGLDVLRRKYGDHYWTPEDVHDECVTGNAHLFMDAMNPGWFMVVKASTDHYTHEPILFIWIVYAPHGRSAGLWTHVEELARRIGAKKIRMESQRTGFVRTGWKVRNIIYEREVS